MEEGGVKRVVELIIRRKPNPLQEKTRTTPETLEDEGVNSSSKVRCYFSLSSMFSVLLLLHVVVVVCNLGDKDRDN